MSKLTRTVPKSVFDASFRYRPSFETDIRRTFERIRRERTTALKEGSRRRVAG